jgi:hypothetical protein
VRLVGVDFTHYVERGDGELEGKRHLVRSGSCLMGETFSPTDVGCQGERGCPSRCRLVYLYG